MPTLFTYGILKRGKRANSYLTAAKATFVGEVRTHSRYHLYRLGWFPGMFADESIEGGVSGELWDVSESCLKRLDVYEGAPDLFRREEIELSDGRRVIAYVYAHTDEDCERVEGGVWQ